MGKCILLAKILLGNLFLAISVNLIILPFGFISGGSTGFALVVQQITHRPFAQIVAVFNVVMFLLGLLCLGWKFALTTLVSTFLYPLLLQLTAFLNPLAVGVLPPLAGCILAGLLNGAGIAIVVQCNASTGGLDIPAIVCNRKLHWNLSVCLGAMDAVLLLSQATFSTAQGIFYGLLLVAATSLSLNYTPHLLVRLRLASSPA